MDDKPRKGLPDPDDLDAVFYAKTAEAGKIAIQSCNHCGKRTHPARYYCPSCASDDFTFLPVSGKARVHSYTVSHFSVESAWKDKVPYVTIVAELEEGPRVIARTDTISPEKIRIGMPIRLEVETIAPEFSYVWAKEDLA